MEGKGGKVYFSDQYTLHLPVDLFRIDWGNKTLVKGKVVL
jgi:hypothetical protein